MATAVSVCSNALIQLGDSPIASFATSEGDRARMCSNLWPQVRDMLLRAYPWPCIRKRAVLAPEATAPAFDWGYSFLLPSDCLRIIQVGERNERPDYEVAGGKILADTDALYIVYAWKNEDPAQWDSVLVDLASCEMAARLAYPITQSASMAKLKRDEADLAMRKAKSIAGQDNEPEEYGDSPFTDVRY